MLTQIRERATGWLAWVIVILITIPFALWGIQSYFENPADLPVATVNGEEIPLYSYYNELSRRRQALLSEAGGNVDPATLDNAAMREEVVEDMIANRLIGQYVRESNYRLSDARLKQRIESNPAFLSDGRFDPNLYRILLRNNGYSPQTFEALERESAIVQQLYDGLAASAFAPANEIDRLLELQAQTRAADYAVVPAERFEAEIEISDADAEQHYRDNLADYEAPARIKVDYIELSVDNLAADIEPTEAEIAQGYEQAAGRYLQPESRKASHILFAVEADADDDARAEILAAAEAVLAEAQGGADFAELAKTHSDDPGSKERGGDLGVVARGQMVEPFEAAVFAMAQDEIRGPVETRFGYHIIQLTELQEERRRELAEVRDEVAAEVARAQAETLFAELSEAFENLVFEDPESLATAAEELGLEVQQTGWFTERAGDPDAPGGVADQGAVRRAAFGEDVVTDDLNSAAIELGFERLVAVRKREYEPPRTRDFDEVRDAVVAELKRQRAAEEIGALGEEMLAALRGEGDGGGSETEWAAALAEHELESETLAETRDGVPGNLSKLGDAVFAQAAPADGAAVYGGVFLDNGDYAVYALSEVAPGDLAAIEPARRQQLRGQLLARDSGDLFEMLRDSIRETASVVIDPDLVQDPDSALEIGLNRPDSNY